MTQASLVVVLCQVGGFIEVYLKREYQSSDLWGVHFRALGSEALESGNEYLTERFSAHWSRMP